MGRLTDKGYVTGTSNPANTDTFHRRDTHVREMDDDGQSNAAADADWRRNLDKFSGNRCDNQALPPTRDNKTPQR